ncbi:MFS transporter [Streptacidiphilus sp. N1-12]|uniref:MFS transporter n=2 Tax=Streptacidiphilus alkalitolerans TaxID=3342712 RepID=A0ABV6VC26_9ACTN
MPDTTSHSDRRRSAPNRWGLPDLHGGSKLLTAAAVDSIGSGLFYAFQVIYFVKVTSLALPVIGLALTLVQLLSLPAPTLLGPLVDRVGPRLVAAGGNLLAAAGFGGFLLVHSAWQIVAAGLVVQIGVSGYWTSSGALVGLAAEQDQRTRWFGLINALRNAGVGLGGAVAALALGAGGTTGLRWLVVGNIVSYLFSAWLIASWRHRGSAEPAAEPAPSAAASEPAGPEPAGGYRAVLRDTAFLRMAVVNLVFVLAAMVLSVLLAVYIVESLHQPVWTAGALLTLNTALVAVFQTPVGRLVELRPPQRVIALAALVNVLAFLLFGLLVHAPSWTVLPGLVLAMLVYTAAEMIQSPVVSGQALELAPEQLRGRYQAVFQLSWGLGGAIAPVVFTSLLTVGPLWPWVLLVVLNLGAAAALGVRARVRTGAAPRPATLPAVPHQQPVKEH